MEAKVDETLGVVNTILAKLEKLDVIENKLGALENEFNGFRCSFQEELNNLDSKLESHKSRLLAVEVRVRKLNLVWFGVKESVNSEDKSDLEMMIDLMVNLLGVQCTESDFEDIFRIGKLTRPNGPPRPLCLALRSLPLKRRILEARTKLAGSTIFVHEDLPKEVRDQRKIDRLARLKPPNGRTSRDQASGNKKRPPTSPVDREKILKQFAHRSMSKNDRAPLGASLE
uniref:Uncharacterized protein n=2 Tax=Lygus hesperus TaxID=30085 RepID=A0A146KY09_LYGHE